MAPLLIRTLTDWLARHSGPVRLVAPSLRVGRQWLAQVARRHDEWPAGVTPTTLKGLAREFAAPALGGLTELAPAARRGLVERLWHGLRRLIPDGYLTALPPTASLTAALARTLADLRMAGLAATDLTPDAFETPAKGRELAVLLAGYENQLRSERWFDEASLWHAAAAAVTPMSLRNQPPLLVPRDLPATGLALRFLDALKAHGGDRCVELPVDEPGTGAPPRSDLERVAWIGTPTAAPPPFHDGTLRVVRVLNEVAEVRHVLRTCLTLGWPLDTVEVIHTDGATYGPLWHEAALTLRTDRTGPLPRGLPITFAEGLPCRLTRPGRALATWVAWVRDDYLQSRFVQLLQEDLVKLPPALQSVGTARWAERFRPLTIGFGRQRYGPAIARELARTAAEEAVRAEWSTFWNWLEPLLDWLPGEAPAPNDVLVAAERFLGDFAAGDSQLDNFARRRMRDLVRAERLGVEAGLAGTTFDPWRWLETLPGQVHVGAAGATPGCLHIAGLAEGGHSGRPHTFLLGLDDSRFPATSGPDPLLLDRERLALSPELPTSMTRQDDARLAFQRLLARLRGTLEVSYPTQNMAEDRERFPSSVAVNLARLHTGLPQADLATLEHALGPPRGLEPAANEMPLSGSDAWRRVLAGREIVPAEVVNKHFPELAHALTAAAARHSASFTPYDGYVPAAGPLCDPATNPAVVVSPQVLEMLGRCPRAYFFRHVLEVAPPRDATEPSDRWLPADARGRLLHDVLHQFLETRAPALEAPRYPDDWPHLRRLLERMLNSISDEFPVRDEHLHRGEVEELHQLVKAFLLEEAKRSDDHRPVHLETLIGMAGGTGTLDCAEPVRLTLTEGLSLRVRGRIDRIDRLGATLDFVVWDYKTGNPARFVDSDLFQEGRRLQHLLYLLMAETRLRELHGDTARVTQFGYYFLHANGLGEKRTWSDAAIRAGAPLLAKLRDVVAAGTFPATTDAKDCSFCDYGSVCNLPADQFNIVSKLRNAGSEMLQPYRELRHAETEPG